MTDSNEPSWQTNPRCDEDQLAMLRRCSKAKDMAEWNEWREANLDEETWLQRADLWDTQLGRADLTAAHLEGASLWGTHLEGAALYRAHLEGADFSPAHLEGAHFNFAILDGETLFEDCSVDRETDFTGVGLGACRIDPGLKQTLEYNIRRKRWLRWCGGRAGGRRPLKKARLSHWARKWPVWLFWQMSDYGRSTGRIALWFITLSLVFAAVYFLCGLASPPGIVEGLFDYERGGQIARINDPALVFLRAAYFSVVTMTTLGFGDINAQPLSYAGHLLLMLQVILGYVLLGALVCRLAILFQAGGPAAKFSKTPKPKPEAPQATDE